MANNIRRQIPLPFQGNKCNRIDGFIEYINSLPDDLMFVDLFGGSCYLSYVIHQLKPNAVIICNDFDDYRERLNNVQITNEILKSIRLINTSKFKNDKYSAKEQEMIRKILIDYGREYSLDILTLSNCLCYSTMRAKNIDQLLSWCYYNRIPVNDYETKWYLKALEGITFVKSDWYELYNKYKDVANVVFIADPPYFNTDYSGYQNHKWSFTDSLRTLHILTQKHYVYYSSNKSQFLTLIEFLNHEFLDDKFKFTCITIQRNGGNKRANPYQDIMLYK